MQKMTPLRIAALILGAVMGSGFVSGREIYQFFTRFGIWGGVGLVCSLIALCALGCVVMQEAGESSCGDPVCALFPDGSPRALRRLGRVILTAALFVMYTGMLAAGGAAFQMEFGLPAWSGALAVAAVSVWWSAGGLQALQRSVGRATPLLTAGLLVAAAYCGFRSPCPPWNSPPPTPGDGVQPLLYLSYNFAAALPVLAAAGASGTSRRDLRRGALLAAAALCGCGLCIHRMLLGYPQQADAAIPLLRIADSLSGGLRALCSFMLLVAVSCAAANGLFGLSGALCGQTGTRRPSLPCAACGFAVSLIGFEQVIQRLYPALGAVGLLLAAAAAAQGLRRTGQGKTGRRNS